MDRTDFDWVVDHTGMFAHSSMQYLGFDDVADYHLDTAKEDIVLLLGYDSEAKCQQYHWATDSVDKLIPFLTCKDPFLLTFVPKEWVSALELASLKIRNKWHDYFRANLDDIEEAPEEEFNFLTADEIHEASALTLQCRDSPGDSPGRRRNG